MTHTLRDIFVAVASKRLVLVDLPKRGSNQHELNGVRELRAFFEASEVLSGEIAWHYFEENHEPLHSATYFRFYDSRARSVARTNRREWRLYYSGDFLSEA